MQCLHGLCSQRQTWHNASAYGIRNSQQYCQWFDDWPQHLIASYSQEYLSLAHTLHKLDLRPPPDQILRHVGFGSCELVAGFADEQRACPVLSDADNGGLDRSQPAQAVISEEVSTA